MLPPTPSSTLEANPHFATLYKHLTEDILAPDGSTLSKVKQYDVVSAQLSEARQAVARDGILLHALEEIALTGNSNADPESRLPRPTNTNTARARARQGHEHDAFDLPPELRELVYNVTAYLSASLDPFTAQTLPADTDDLMADELSTFQQHLPTIAKAVSTHLADTESSLAALATASFLDSHPSPSSSLPHHKPVEKPSSSSLSAILSASHNPNPAHHSQSHFSATLLPLPLPLPLTHPLKSTTATLTTLLTAHTSTLQSAIRTLELTTHGTTSRHTASRAIYLASVSRGIELKARIMRLEHEKALYGDEDVTGRLEREGDTLGVEERRLARRERELRALLGEYEREGGRAAGRIGSDGGGDGARRGEKEEGTGEDVFRALGERYAEVEKELEGVKRDIGRLETKIRRER
ncbi:putative alpha-1,6-mannosyltransferase mnn11 [Exophiala xenobiotica]|uniref:Alpha-1,6-mannosyltransferase mnn11 n=1 Tax=Lithohypha guttulata TaxID=1690604 RepID=A0ABR0KPC2_9EURO|nr:putative alpha-1,6-mannosyltransferase mnn11 [Lithohypha guttulata]KAK5330868.1 putative alpha-1,6-mannosyltransferase mnn11 [Exophiala xenobiotica]